MIKTKLQSSILAGQTYKLLLPVDFNIATVVHTMSVPSPTKYASDSEKGFGSFSSGRAAASVTDHRDRASGTAP